MRWRREWKKIEGKAASPQPSLDPLRPLGSLAGPPSHRALCSPRSARLGIQLTLQGPRYAPLKRGQLGATDIAEALSKLLQYRTPDGRYLVTRKVHWQAIFRILVDRGIYPDGTDYRGFCCYMDKACPTGGYRVPLSYLSLKNISRTMYVRPFAEWRYDAVYGISRQAYERMYRIAATLNELLEY